MKPTNRKRVLVTGGAGFLGPHLCERFLAEMALDKFGGPSRSVFEPLPLDDPRQRRPDISLASQVLGWSPTIQLSEGLDRSIDYFRCRLQA